MKCWSIVILRKMGLLPLRIRRTDTISSISMTSCTDEAFDMNCIIHLAKNDVFGRITLLDFEQKLTEKNKDMFKRVHKSYLVNRYHTKSLARYELMLEHEIRVPVSQERYNDVRDWLNHC